jgi:aminoglycoside phosphotransferase (APT) family kinase protein
MTAAGEPLADLLAPGARERFGDAAAIERIERLVGGASGELWGFDVVDAAGARHALVLRRDPVAAGEGQGAGGVSGADDRTGRVLELAILGAAHAHGVPVPEPLWAIAGNAEGGGGYVMTRLGGEAIPRRLLRDERFATARERLVGQLAAAAAATHAVPLDAIPGLSHPDGDPAAAAIAALEAELDRIGEPHPALELGLRWLRSNLPDPATPALVHGDFRLGNVLVDEDGLAGLLDWELCHAGDPAEDLGWLCIRSWRFGNDDRPAAGLGTRAELLAAYRAAGGRTVTADDLRFWEVYGNVRWGVICLVQADVHLSGVQRSLERAAIGRRTCEPEWDLLAMIG